MARPPKSPVRKGRQRPTEPVRKRPQDFGEKCLHAHAQQWLVKSGLWGSLLIFHVPNERRGSFGAIAHFKRMGVRNGVADYLAFAPGRLPVAIELKDDDGDQRDDQIKFQRHWERLGYLYFLVRTLEDFQRIVQSLTLFG